MPRLRPSLRVLDAPGAVAPLPDLRRRRSAEAAVGVRRAVEHAGEVVLAPVGQRTHRSMWHLWRPARAGFLLDQLNSTRLWASGFGPQSVRANVAIERRGRRTTWGPASARLEEVRLKADASCLSAGSASSALIVMSGYADLPDDADRILSDEWIGREDGEPVNDGLGHKNPIEWVAMQGWQASDVE